MGGFVCRCFDEFLCLSHGCVSQARFVVFIHEPLLFGDVMSSCFFVVYASGNYLWFREVECSGFIGGVNFSECGFGEVGGY